MPFSPSDRVRYHRRPPSWLVAIGSPDWEVPVSAGRDLAQVRMTVRDRLSGSVHWNLADEACLVVTELAANALQHGGGNTIVQGWQRELGVVLGVSEAGLGSAERVRSPIIPRGGPLFGGLGLSIAASIATIDVVSTREGTVVLATVPAISSTSPGSDGGGSGGESGRHVECGVESDYRQDPSAAG